MPHTIQVLLDWDAEPLLAVEAATGADAQRAVDAFLRAYPFAIVKCDDAARVRGTCLAEWRDENGSPHSRQVDEMPYVIEANDPVDVAHAEACIEDAIRSAGAYFVCFLSSDATLRYEPCLDAEPWGTLAGRLKRTIIKPADPFSSVRLTWEWLRILTDQPGRFLRFVGTAGAAPTHATTPCRTVLQVYREAVCGDYPDDGESQWLDTAVVDCPHCLARSA